MGAGDASACDAGLTPVKREGNRARRVSAYGKVLRRSLPSSQEGPEQTLVRVGQHGSSLGRPVCSVAGSEQPRGRAGSARKLQRILRSGSWRSPREES